MQSEQINEIAAALAKAQSKIKNPVRNRKVTVVTKTGGKYEFEYADLAAITDAIREPLSENAIAVTHYMDEIDGRNRLITKLVHVSGQWFGTSRPLFVAEQTSQALMSAETYAKRGNICALVNVSAETDDDANMADGNDARPVPKGALTPTGWEDYAKKMIEIAKSGQASTPEQRAKMAEMQGAAPEVYKRMLAAMKTVKTKAETKPKEQQKEPEQPPQPKPDDDPDAYRVWLLDQLSKYDKKKDVDDFYAIQRPLWEPCFPPDIEDWESLVKERAKELK